MCACNMREANEPLSRPYQWKRRQSKALYESFHTHMQVNPNEERGASPGRSPSA